MTTTNLLGAAVVGLGVGEKHAIAYARCDGSVLRCVYDVDRQRMHRVALNLCDGRAAASLQEVLDDPTVDIVSIASFDDCHYEEVISALKAGKHVFVEKPLCRSMEELRHVARAWRNSRRLWLTSNLVLRAAPLYQWLRDAIRSGVFGDIYAFDGEYLYGRIHKITQEWRKDVDDYSVMQGGGVHMVDLMLWLTGQEPRAVTAVGNRICTQGTAFRYKDFVASTFEFESGLIGRIVANFGCVHRHQHVVRVYGTKATFLYDDKGPRFHTARDPDSRPEALDLSPLPRTKGDLIPGFVQSILHNEKGSAATQHEFNVISVCVASDQALSQSRRVNVEYV